MMKSWILILVLCTGLGIIGAGCGRKKSMTYAPNIEKFKTTFYAQEKPSELVAGINLADKISPDDPFAMFANAVKQQEAGQNEMAKAELKKIAAMKNVEARVRVWAWNGLRELGEQPDATIADKPQGVVIEIQAGGSLDTLAAFSDGSARYINYSGKVIVWDKPDKQINGLAKNLVASAESLVLPSNLAVHRNPLASGRERVTVLTFSGNHAVETKSGGMDQTIQNAALELMLALISEATKVNQNPQ